tara:strand:+ start:524 stop:1090 length:567 start_codon:yes stop_codon:yes gene_type:complete
MKYGNTRTSATDLSDWDSVEQALSRKHSRERRLRAATDLLDDVDTAIRQHEHEHRRLMDAGELVMPEDSIAYGQGLWHVKWQLEREIERLTALTGGDFNADEPEGTHDDPPESHPSLSKPKEPKEDDLLSLREVARLLGVSYSTVRKKPLRDELPAIKIGARVMVRRSALRKWLEARERKNRGGRIKR